MEKIIRSWSYINIKFVILKILLKKKYKKWHYECL